MSLSYPREKLSREDALHRGELIYWGKRECPKGHGNWRYTSNHNCVTCGRERISMMKAVRKKFVTDDSNRNADARRKAEALLEEMRLAKESEYFDF